MEAGDCKECGSSTVFDADVGSRICTSCGTLEDPSQSVLASHLDFAPHGDSTREFPLSSFNTDPLKSLRTRDGWNLAGSTKEVQEHRNIIAMQKYVQSLATSLAHPGLAPRTLNIFHQARIKSPKFRWGHQARRLAGASLAVALREANKADSLRDIAYLVNERHTSLNHSFTYIARTLNLSVAPTNPAHHVPSLKDGFLSLLQSTSHSTTSSPSLPADLKQILSPLIPNLASIVRTTTSLCSLLSSSSSSSSSSSIDSGPSTSHLPPGLLALAAQPNPPTATAAFLLSIESELKRSLPHLSLLAEALGARIGAGQRVVMQRYKIIYEAVLVGVDLVPWLDKHEKTNSKGKESAGKRQMAKRVLVARGLKDVLSFWEEIWRKGMESQEKPVLVFAEEAEEAVTGEDDESGDESVTSSALSISRDGNKRSNAFADTGPPKKRKRGARKLEEASRFLLNPLSSSFHKPLKSSSACTSTSTSASTSREATPAQPAVLSPAHLLNTATLSLHRPLTRLQMLVSERGGEEEVDDDELFEEGELEGLLRADDEVEAVHDLMGFGDESEEAEQQNHREKTTRKGDGGTRRIDMEKLGLLLAQPGSTLEEDNDLALLDISDVEEVSEWRPLSPNFGGYGGDAEERFDF